MSIMQRTHEYIINQNMVVYIPNINKNIGMEFISNLFKKLDIADVGYIHFEKMNTQYNAATIYMNKWYYNQVVENLQERINNPDLDARLIYDDPLYWELFNKADIFQESSLITNKLTLLEKKLSKINDLLEMQAKEILNLSKFFDQLNSAFTNKRKMHMMADNSCCGAASDAWVPSYPPDNPNTLRMRPR